MSGRKTKYPNFPDQREDGRTYMNLYMKDYRKRRPRLLNILTRS